MSSLIVTVWILMVSNLAGEKIYTEQHASLQSCEKFKAEMYQGKYYKCVPIEVYVRK